MIDDDDIQAHIGDYLQILAHVHAEPGISANKEHEIAMTIMIVHEMHRTEHLHKRRPE